MTAYDIGVLRSVRFGQDIVDYLERIDATLEPFGGRFVVHGAAPEVREGSWDGSLVIIAFPDLDAARGWYDSPAYQEILPLRTDNSEGVTMLVEGVVAPRERIAKVRRELSRPTFRAVALDRRCAYFSSEALLDASDSLMRWASDPSVVERLASRVAEEPRTDQ